MNRKVGLLTRGLVIAVICQMLAAGVVGQPGDPGEYNDPPSRMRGVIERFNADVGILDRFYSAGTSAKRYERFRALYQERLTTLAAFNFDALNHDEQVDYILFKNYLDHEKIGRASCRERV